MAGGRPLPDNDLDRALDQAQQWLRSGDGLAGGIAGGRRVAVEIVAGLPVHHPRVVGRRSWAVLGEYIRAPLSWRFGRTC